MNFDEIKQLIYKHCQENGSDDVPFYVNDLIEENEIIENLTYPIFMDLTIDFFEKKFQKLKLSNIDNLLEDLKVSKDFLSKKISIQQVENRRVIAWEQHDKLKHIEQHAQRLTITLLYPSVLNNEPDPTDQMTPIEFILDYLSLIDDEFPILYYWKLYKNLNGV